MTLQKLPTAARPVSDDGKPTQINEHKRDEETRASEHEPHAMASESGAQEERTHPQ